MYKNPLNNGDLSDYNLLKNQRDNTEIIKKYTSRKLKQGIPTETQKYNEYLTYQQPILDELNEASYKMKNSNEEKLKKNFYVLENLRIKREKEMKDKVDREVKDNTVKEMIKKDLFENTSFIKSDDKTPTINTNLDIENKTPTINRNLDMENIKNKAARVLQAVINRAEIQPLYRERLQTENEMNQIKKEEEAAVKIEKALLDKVKRNRAKKELFEANAEPKKLSKEEKAILKEQALIERKNNQSKNTEAANLLKAAIKRAETQPIYRAGAEYQREVAKKDTEREKKITDINKAIKSDESLSNIPRNKRGRPKGSKDTVARLPRTKTRTLDLS